MIKVFSPINPKLTLDQECLVAVYAREKGVTHHEAFTALYLGGFNRACTTDGQPVVTGIDMAQGRCQSAEITFTPAAAPTRIKLSIRVQ